MEVRHLGIQSVVDVCAFSNPCRCLSQLLLCEVDCDYGSNLDSVRHNCNSMEKMTVLQSEISNLTNEDFWRIVDFIAEDQHRRWSEGQQKLNEEVRKLSK